MLRLRDVARHQQTLPPSFFDETLRFGGIVIFIQIRYHEVSAFARIREGHGAFNS